MPVPARLVSSSLLPYAYSFQNLSVGVRSIAAGESGEPCCRFRRAEVSRALVPLAGEGGVGGDAVGLEERQLRRVIGRRQPKGSRRQANLGRALKEIPRCRDIACNKVVEPTRQEILGARLLCRRKLR